jgi:hypothetical protein
MRMLPIYSTTGSWKILPELRLSEVLEAPSSSPSTAPSTAPTEARVPDMGQCRGPPLQQQELCRDGSGCVFQSLERSICLPNFDNVPVDCIQEVFEICGGQGYAGCQNCPTGSTCAMDNPFRYSCIPDDFGPPEPVLQNNDLPLAYQFVQGLDADLDNLVAMVDFNANSMEDDLIQAVRARMSLVYASDAALARFRQLLSTDPTFQQFNAQSQEELQDTLCSQIQSLNSQLSTEIKNCICNGGPDPFVYCSARLEQEFNQFSAARRRRRRLRNQQHDHRQSFQNFFADTQPVSYSRQSSISRQKSRNLQSCEPDIIAEIQNLIKRLTGEPGSCVKVGCSFPIPVNPALVIEFDAEFCAPTTVDLIETLIDFDDIQQRRDTSNAVSITLSLGLCVNAPDLDDKAAAFLEFLGVEFCFLTLEGSIRPVIGILEGTVRANLGLPIGGQLFVQGQITYLAYDELRNLINLCPDNLDCTADMNSDCALCVGNINYEVKVGIRFLFFAPSVTVARSEPPERCAVYDENGSCRFLTEAPSSTPTMSPTSLAPTVTPGNPTLSPTTVAPTPPACLPRGARCLLGSCGACCSGRAFLFVCL